MRHTQERRRAEALLYERAQRVADAAAKVAWDALDEEQRLAKVIELLGGDRDVFWLLDEHPGRFGVRFVSGPHRVFRQVRNSRGQRLFASFKP